MKMTRNMPALHKRMLDRGGIFKRESEIHATLLDIKTQDG